MANGQQVAEQNLAAFVGWSSSKSAKIRLPVTVFQ